MTILPKKKTSKDKNDPENGDHSKAYSHGHLTNSGDPRSHGRGRTSPPRWLPSTSREADKLNAHDPGGGFETETTGVHNVNKRRHRSSPHRNVMLKHRSHASSLTHAVHGHGVAGVGPAANNGLAPAAVKDYDDSQSGYNSGDEHDHCAYAAENNVDELDRRFENTLKEHKGFIIKKMRDDGACLFRAVADQVYGDQEMHVVVRKHCIDYMAKNADYYKQYVTEDFNKYLNRKRREHCHGNHLEMQAMCEMYNRPIEVYQYSLEPINTFHSSYKTDNEPVRISYHHGVHYNSVIDPLKATIGVGLGLPGHQPGLADKNLIADVARQSEDFHIEEAMFSDKIRETDWEVTQESINEQVARESYLQWLRDQEKLAKRQDMPHSASATCSSSCDTVPYRDMCDHSSSAQLPRGSTSRGSNSGSGQNSPQRMDTHDSNTEAGLGSKLLLPIPGVSASMSPGQSPPLAGAAAMTGATSDSSHSNSQLTDDSDANMGFQETASIMNQLPTDAYGFSGWSEDEILAQVIAQSQQEYFDSLKRSAIFPSMKNGANESTNCDLNTDGASGYTPYNAPSTSHASADFNTYNS